MKKLFYTDTPLIGFEINTTDMKIMSIDPRRWSILGYGAVDVDPKQMKLALEEKSDYLTEATKKLLGEKIVGVMPSKNVVLGMPTSRTYSRAFSIPASAEKHLTEAVELEVSQYVPVPLSMLYVDYEVISRTKEELSVVASAVPRNAIDNAIEACDSAGLTVVAIEPGINAIARLVKATENGDNLATLIVDISPANTDIAVLDGTIRVTGGTAIGGNTFTLDIAKKLDLPLENAHQLKVLHGLNPGPRQAKIVGAMKPSLQRIVTEIRRVLRYYNERIENGRKLEQVLIVGGGSNVPGIGEYFTNELVMPARVASPWQKFDFGSLQPPTKQFRPRYLTVAGLGSVTNEEVWQ